MSNHSTSIWRSNNFLIIEITTNVCPRYRYSILYFLNHKFSVRPICSLAIHNNFFEFRYCQIVTNFEFRIFVIMLKTIVNIHTWLNISRLHFYCLMICFLLFSTTLSNLMFQQNNPSIFAVNINNTQQESDLLIVFAYWLHICKIYTPNFISIRWVYLALRKFSINESVIHWLIVDPQRLKHWDMLSFPPPLLQFLWWRIGSLDPLKKYWCYYISM